MCNTSKTYKLCTCEGDLDKAETVWTLTRFLGLDESTMIMGSIIPPSDAFVNGISSDKLIRQMNSGNCFDFDYSPTERDSLHVSIRNGSYEYFDLIYREGKWKKGGNPHFTSILETIGTGKIEKSN